MATKEEDLDNARRLKSILPNHSHQIETEWPRRVIDETQAQTSDFNGLINARKIFTYPGGYYILVSPSSKQSLCA